MLKIDFPAIKHWKIAALQKVSGGLLDGLLTDSEVYLEFRDFDIKFNCNFKLTEEGYLTPVVYATDLKFGETSFYHENWFFEMITFHLVKYCMVVIQNSVYFMGEYIFSGMLEPVLTRFLWNYKLFLWLPVAFDGQSSYNWDWFDLDFRNVRVPDIQQNYIDFYITGELIWRGWEGCPGVIKDDGLSFFKSTELSQLVVTQSEMTCIMNKMARSDLGILDLNEKRWNQLFRVEGIKLTSGSLKDKIKIFYDKKGDQPMKFDVKFKDINVILGQYDVDMILEYTMMVSFGLDQTAVPAPAQTTTTNDTVTENPFGLGNSTGPLVDPDPDSIPAEIEPLEWLYDEF
jgi:hypothetical protein